MEFHVHSFSDEAGKALSVQIAALKRNGHEGMEIRGIDDKNISLVTMEEAKEIKNKLDAEGLSVWSIGSPIGKIGIEDDFAPHKELFKHCLDLAEFFGAKAFRLFSFHIPVGEDPEKYEAEVIDRMGAMCDIAKNYDVVLCHENEKRIFGDVASRCVKLHKALPDLKAIFDPANFIQCGQETLSAWEMLKGYVHYMHVKDALECGVVVPAGEGIGHVPEIIDAYIKQGGRNFTLEPHLLQLGTDMQIEKELLGKFIYPTPDASFDAASNALKNILAKY